MEWTDPGQSINFHKFGDTQNFDLYDIWSCDSWQHAHHICSKAGGRLIAWGMSLQRVTNRIEVGRKSMRLKLPTKISLDTDRQAQSRLTSCLLTFHVHCQESGGSKGEREAAQEEDGEWFAC